MVDDEIYDINKLDDDYIIEESNQNEFPNVDLRKEAGDDAFLKLLYCSKTGKAMKNPVITADGMWYERDFIENYLSTGNQNDPVTGKKFLNKILIDCPRLSELAYLYDIKHSVSEERMLCDYKDKLEQLSNEKLELEVKIKDMEEKTKKFFESAKLQFAKFKVKIINDLKIERLNVFQLEKLLADVLGKDNETEGNPDKKDNPENNLQEQIQLENWQRESEEKLNKKIEEIDKELLPVFDAEEDVKRLGKYDFKLYIESFGQDATVKDMKIIEEYNSFNNKHFVDDLGWNIFLRACRSGCSLDVIKYLVEIGVDYRKKDNIGRTALHLANWKNTKAVCEYLHCLGLKVSENDFQSYTPLHYACQYNNFEVVLYSFETFINTTKYDKSLLSKLVTKNGHNLLHCAACNNKIEVIEFILPKFDINSKDKSHNTPLHIACRWNGVEAIKFLVSKGSDTTCRNLKDRLTAYEFGLVKNLRPEVLEYLSKLCR